jgi:hypothetical protein
VDIDLLLLIHLMDKVLKDEQEIEESQPSQHTQGFEVI